VQTLSTIECFISDAACAILYTLSIAISLGIVIATFTHHLLPMALATVAGLNIAAAAGGPPPSWGKL
jgi:hypothetical protein